MLALAQALEESGLSVWYDDFVLRIGDSLRDSISIGLSQSTYAIVVLSPIYFEKKWPKRELNALLGREDSEEKVIIPIWHQISKEEIQSSFPLIADKLAVRSDEGMENVIRRIFEVVKPTLIAQKHYEEGLMFEENELLDEAMLSYLRALRLNNKHVEAQRRVNSLQNLSLPQPLYVTDTNIRVGIVRFYSEMKGFGFIAGEDVKEYFVHATGLEEGTTLHVRDRVAFLVEKGYRGPIAVAVRII